jgi:8-oxo-dGTP diphosphatase
LFDKDKRILLQHRAKDAERLPDFWGFFGGGIEKGETPEQALIRESQEELDYTPRKPRLLIIQNFEHQNDKNIKYVFVEEFDNKIELHQSEGQAMAWFSLEETKTLKMIDHDRAVIKYIEGKY